MEIVGELFEATFSLFKIILMMQLSVYSEPEMKLCGKNWKMSRISIINFKLVVALNWKHVW